MFPGIVCWQCLESVLCSGPPSTLWFSTTQLLFDNFCSTTVCLWLGFPFLCTLVLRWSVFSAGACWSGDFPSFLSARWPPSCRPDDCRVHLSVWCHDLSAGIYIQEALCIGVWSSPCYSSFCRCFLNGGSLCLWMPSLSGFRPVVYVRWPSCVAAFCWDLTLLLHIPLGEVTAWNFFVELC